METRLTLFDDKQRARYELAKIPEVVAALDSCDRIIYKAQFSRPAGDYKMPELLKALPAIIKDASMKVGCRITDGDMAFVVNMAASVLSRHFPMITLQDFSTAFEMCALGELDKYLPKRDGNADRGHYQMFNTEYMAKVLKAYRLRRAETMRKAEEVRPKANTTDTEAENKKADRVAKDMFYLDYLYYKYHERMPVISPAAVIIYAKILARLGWIDAQFSEVFPAEQAGAIAAMTDTLARRVPRAHEWTERKRREIERAFRDMVEDEIQFDKFI